MRGCLTVLLALVSTWYLAPSFAQSFNVNPAYITLHSLNNHMETAVPIPEAFQADLGPVAKLGGYCPSMLDVFWKFPAAAVEECLSPAVVSTMKKCNVVVDGKIGPGGMSGAASCLSALSSQLDFSKPLDRASKLLPDSVSCMAKGVVRSLNLSQAEQRTALGAIDGVKATYDEYQKLSKLAIGLATSGPGVIPDFLAVDASGNDGDAKSVSIADWLIEVDKIADDPLAYAHAQTSGQLSTSLTTTIANAVMNPIQSLEELHNYWDPDRPLGGTGEMLRQCQLADAQIVWASRRAGLEARLQDARASLEFYRIQTWCQLSAGSQDFDGMSTAQRQHLLTGDGAYAPSIPASTNFERWQRYAQQTSKALDAYARFREKEAAFQLQYENRASDLSVYLSEAQRLKDLARSNIRKCVGESMSPTTTIGISRDPVRDMNAAVLDLKAQMLGFGCSIPMADSFVAEINNEINNPYLKWGAFLSDADRCIGWGLACTAAGSRQLLEDLQSAAADSFGSILSMQQCSLSDDERRTVGDIFSLSVELESLDGQIAKAASLVTECDKLAAKTEIDRAGKLLLNLPCPDLPGKAGRAAILQTLSSRLQLPECGSSPVGNLQVVYRVTGSGYIPHYANGSFFTSGYHDVAVALKEAPTQAKLDQILKQAHARYQSDPCEAEMPAIPGLAKTPTIWLTGPQVAFIRGPGVNSADIDLEDTWQHSEDDFPPLSELLGGKCQ